MIKCAEFNDIAFIAELEAQCIECAWSQIMHEDAYKTDGYQYFVYKDIDSIEINTAFKDNNSARIQHNNIKGYIIIRIILDEAEICNIAVAKAYRRKKIAQSLLDIAHNYVKSQGCKSMILEVSAVNTPAITLYKNNDYHQIAIRKNYYKSGDAIIMKKSFPR